MGTSFKNWFLEQELMESDDPMAAFRALRAQAGWDWDINNGRVGGDAKPVQTEPAKPEAGAAPARPLNQKYPNAVLDLIQKGLKEGGPVPDQIAKILDLSGRNASLVSHSYSASMYMGRVLKPFAQVMRAGKVIPNKFEFVPNYPFHRLLSELA